MPLPLPSQTPNNEGQAMSDTTPWCTKDDDVVTNGRNEHIISLQHILSDANATDDHIIRLTQELEASLMMAYAASRHAGLSGGSHCLA